MFDTNFEVATMPCERGISLIITGDDYMCVSTTGEDNAQVFESGGFGILWRA